MRVVKAVVDEALQEIKLINFFFSFFPRNQAVLSIPE
jgi:hypothetical protein